MMPELHAGESLKQILEHEKHHLPVVVTPPTLEGSVCEVVDADDGELGITLDCGECEVILVPNVEEGMLTMLAWIHKNKGRGMGKE